MERGSGNERLPVYRRLDGNDGLRADLCRSRGNRKRLDDRHSQRNAGAHCDTERKSQHSDQWKQFDANVDVDKCNVLLGVGRLDRSSRDLRKPGEWRHCDEHRVYAYLYGCRRLNERLDDRDGRPGADRVAQRQSRHHCERRKFDAHLECDRRDFLHSIRRVERDSRHIGVAVHRRGRVDHQLQPHLHRPRRLGSSLHHRNNRSESNSQLECKSCVHSNGGQFNPHLDDHGRDILHCFRRLVRIAWNQRDPARRAALVDYRLHTDVHRSGRIVQRDDNNHGVEHPRSDRQSQR